MSIGQAFQKDDKSENYKINKAKISYNEDTQELFVNESLHFTKVSKAVWEYKIGGYQVLDKYLKSHKGENIDYAHFENVIKILDKSLQIEMQIAKIELDKT